MEPQIKATTDSIETIAARMLTLLRDAIVRLELKPGDSISEAEIADRYGVSRQPVREAFIRLAQQGLLLIRPKRATLVKRIAAVSEEVLEVNPDILEKVSRRDNPQTVIGVFEQAFTPLADLKPDAATCWVALQAVRDPGNLGTIVRTADAAGCGGVILVGDCCDPYSVEAVRATMGSIFAVPLFKATIPEFLAWRQGWPGSVVGTLLTATTDYRAADYRRPTLILMGNEQQGLPPEVAAACDVNVKIPMRGRADSLNLSVATGIMIYAATE